MATLLQMSFIVECQDSEKCLFIFTCNFDNNSVVSLIYGINVINFTNDIGLVRKSTFSLRFSG